jgi:O-antigen/teichoic acid export membrane protein
MMALRIARRSVGFISAVMLARIIPPEEYGIVAVGIMCVSFSQILTEIGVKQHLIKHRKHTNILLNTAWTVEMLRGVLIFLLIVGLAPLVAEFFRLPEAIQVMRVLAILPLLRSAANIRIVYFRRELEFNKEFIYEASGAVAGVSVAIVSGIVLRNAWALVFGQLATVIVSTCMSYVFYPKMPCFSLDKQSIRTLYEFGRWVLIGSLVSYIALEGDKYAMGRLFGPRSLGVYRMASMILIMGIREPAKAITTVFFSAYSKASNDMPRLKRMFLEYYSSLVSILSPFGLIMLFAAEDFAKVVLGEKWIEIIPYLKILSLASITSTFFLSAGGLFWSINKPKWNTFCEISRASILVLLITSLHTVVGSIGIPISMLAANVFVLFLYAIFWIACIGIDLANLALVLLPIVAALAASALGTAALSEWIRPGIVRLVVVGFCGSALYFGVLFSIGIIFGIGPKYISSIKFRLLDLVKLGVSRLSRLLHLYSKTM